MTIGLRDTCCLTLVFLTMPFMLTFFLIIRCKPCLALVSAAVLSLTSFFLAWLALVEYLKCVVALFILCMCQNIGTFVYLARRRQLYNSGWLAEQADDRENPMAGVLGHVLQNATQQHTTSMSIGAAVARASGSEDTQGMGVMHGSAGGSGGLPMSPSLGVRRSTATRRYSSPECTRTSANASRSPMSLSELLDDFKEEMGARRQAKAEGRRLPDLDDKNDPHNWSLDQLRAYLTSTLPPGRDNTAATKIITVGAHEYLVKRTCEVTGRVFRPGPSEDDVERAAAAKFREPDGESAPHQGAAAERAERWRGVAEGERTSGWRMASRAETCSNARLSSPRHEAKLDDSIAEPDDVSFQKRIFRVKRLQRLFPHLYDEDDDATLSSGSAPGAAHTSYGGSATCVDEGYRRRPRGVPQRSTGGEDRDAASANGSRSPPRRSRTCNSTASATMPSGATTPCTLGGVDHDGAFGSVDGERQEERRSSRDDDEAAQERQRRREETYVRGEERRRENEERSRLRREERESRAQAKVKAANAAASAGGDAKADAARRVAAWSEGKDFFDLLSTLDAFDGLSLHKGIGTSRDLAPGAPSAAIKKAFHRASLSLHPDRLVGLATPRRSEAEEIFKCLSAEYEKARETAQATEA